MHRDIKPENVIFKNSLNDEVVLVDFGFASHIEDYKELFTRCGTPGFVAPEVLRDQDYNYKVDVYSVGIIFYLMISGDIPFASSSYEELVEKNL